MRIFWLAPAQALTGHRNAHTAPNSSGLPKRLAGFAFRAASVTSSTGRFELPASAFKLDFNRSVSKVPGRTLLMVTLCSAVERASPATKPVRPESAPLDRTTTATAAGEASEVSGGVAP